MNFAFGTQLRRRRLPGWPGFPSPRYSSSGSFSKALTKVFSPMPPGVQITPDLPRWLRMAIADAVVLFGRLEQQMVEIAWLVNNADLAQKIKSRHVKARDNFMAVLKFIEAHEPGLRLDGVEKGFSRLANDRNLMVHGAWYMAGDRPWVVWHKFVEDEENIIGEYFDRSKFEFFDVAGKELLSTFRHVHADLENATGIKTNPLPRFS